MLKRDSRRLGNGDEVGDALNEKHCGQEGERCGCIVEGAGSGLGGSVRQRHKKKSKALALKRRQAHYVHSLTKHEDQRLI